MPLTLNSNSLAIGGSGSGLSSAEAVNLIKQNASWTFIEKLTANGDTSLDFTNSAISNHKSLFVYFDGLDQSDQTNTQMRMYLDGSLNANSYYATSILTMTGSSRNASGSGSYTYWLLGGVNYVWGNNITGAMYVSGIESGSFKSMKSNLTAGTSNACTNFEGSGFYTQTGSVITGISIYPNTGTFTSGAVHMYGLNNHD